MELKSENTVTLMLGGDIYGESVPLEDIGFEKYKNGSGQWWRMKEDTSVQSENDVKTLVKQLLVEIFKNTVIRVQIVPGPMVSDSKVAAFVNLLREEKQLFFA